MMRISMVETWLNEAVLLLVGSEWHTHTAGHRFAPVWKEGAEVQLRLTLRYEYCSITIRSALSLNSSRWKLNTLYLPPIFFRCAHHAVMLLHPPQTHIF